MPAPQAVAVTSDQFTSFGELLKFLRRRAGLSQRELSIAVGYSESQVSRLERNERAPDIAALAARFVAALALEQDREWIERLLQLGAESHADRELKIEVSPSPNTAHNLPNQLTSFIGREQELAELKRLLTGQDGQGAVRLLTLTGMGGSGKTRLALQTAAELLTDFPDGVWLVELAPLSNPELVPQTVATTLGLREQPGRPLREVLLEHVRHQNILLLLDNCEHLIQATAQLADAILRSSSQVKILATSREPLAITGETPYGVPALSLPDVRHLPDAKALTHYDAVRLFVERAALLQPGFCVTEENAPAIARVCDQLDGIPLALELAAARIDVLSVEQIALRLDDRFHLLTGASRTVLPRQQTLRAAMDWSYQLLTPAEQILLRRLSVFMGDWSLEAAERVASDDDSIRRRDVLDLLARLIAKSLVRTQVQGSTMRYHMLETIRQYAREKLVASGESEHVQNAHLDYFCELGEAAEADLEGDLQATWLNRLELDHDNLRAALDWSRTRSGNSTAGLRLASALSTFWSVRSYFQEGRDYLMAALAQDPSDRTIVRAHALERAGYLSFMQGDYPAARAVVDASLALYQALVPANRRRLASTFVLRGYIESEVGEYATGSAFILQGLEIMRELQDKGGMAHTLRDLAAFVLRAGDSVRASRYLEEALPLLQHMDPHGRAMTLTSIAEIALRQGDYARAGELEQQSLALRRDLGDKWGIAVSLGNLAWAFLKRGDLEQAVAHLQESVTLRRDIGDAGGIAWCLEKLAQVALQRAQSKSARLRRENFQRAARLLGAAAALRAPSGSVVDLIDRAEYERQRRILEEELHQAPFARIWAEGQAMSLEQTIEYAFPRHEPTPSVAQAGPLPTPKGGRNRPVGGLTARQHQVAVLLAQGKSNRAIAVQLVVSERTVENHIANIMSRLELTSRTQIAMWAVEQGLTRAARRAE